MKMVYKAMLLAAVAAIGFALISTYGTLVGTTAAVGMVFVAFEYISRKEEGE